MWLGSAYRVWGGFDSAVRFAHVLAQPALPCLKLVEPGCDEGAARVETSCVWLGTRVGFWVAGWGVVSTQPFASLAR